MAWRTLVTAVIIGASLTNNCSAVVETIVETFSGNGDFDGFDNPNWSVSGNGQFTDGGYAIVNGGIFLGESDSFSRDLSGRGSFVSRVEIRDLYLGDIEIGNDPSGSKGVIQLFHRLVPDTGAENLFAIRLSEASVSEDDELGFGMVVPNSQEGIRVPSGTDIALEIAFDAVRSQVFFTYDSDILDDTPGITIGPVDFDGIMSDLHETKLTIGSFGTGRADGLLSLWSITPWSTVVGDFNGNGVLDLGDIDLLSAEVNAATNDGGFDLNADSLVDDLDRTVWVHDLKNTFFGDTDLNGEFGSTDLVQVLSFGEYEDGVAMNSTWLTGDWDGNGDFTSGDLVFALADGGYEQGPRAGVGAVPEPSSTVLLIAAVLTIVSRCRKPRPNAMAMG